MYFPIVKQRQSSNTVEHPQVPFIERSSIKSQAQLDIVSIGRSDGSASSGPNRKVSSNNKVLVVEVPWFVQP